LQSAGGQPKSIARGTDVPPNHAHKTVGSSTSDPAAPFIIGQSFNPFFGSEGATLSVGPIAKYRNGVTGRQKDTSSVLECLYHLAGIAYDGSIDAPNVCDKC
jgi:hypothetical protein